MKRLFIPLFFLLPALFYAQTCLYLAYDGFDYPANSPLEGQAGGTGWAAGWYVQVNDATIPGYQTVNAAGSLNYGALLTQGRYATGGKAYLTAGRRLATAENGPFDAYVGQDQNGIGTAYGDTLWVSFLLRKDLDNDEPVWFDLHNDGNIPWCTNCASQHIAAGYFGSANSNVAGQRRWTLRLNGNYYPAPVAVAPGVSTFFVLRIIFNQGNTTVDLYLNPAELGDNPPLSPTLSQSAGTGNVVRSAGLYLGSNPGNGAFDELRLATRYACVAPDNTVSINLPPVAAFSAAPASGAAPLSVSFDAGASVDPENGPLDYLWNFGDASPLVSGPTAAHTFTDLGQIVVALTVTDNMGLQHTAYQTVTITDPGGAFPCQSAFSVLNMAACGQDNGRIRISSSMADNFSLHGPNGQIVPPASANEYHDLAAGIYTFTASSGEGCRDTFSLHIRTDSTACPGWEPDACNLRIGTNMSGFADWVVERPMKNLMKHVRPEPIPYTPDCFCWYIPVLDEMSFDENGYPDHIPQTTSAGSNTVVRYIISSDDANLQPGQTYVLLYDGTGSLGIPSGVNTDSHTPGRLQFTVTSGGNIWIDIAASDATDHLRNFRLLRLADETADLDADPFYQGFLDKIEPFSALRFMDWGATNGSPLEHWDQRSSTSYFTYGTPFGVPYEVMIELANRTHKDIWICVPHAADEAYVTQMAALFKNELDPGLSVYLEYSNEVWNWIFAQAHYNDQHRPNNLNYGRAYAEKARRTFLIWHEVWGEQRGRVKRVLGMQATYNYLNEHILSQLDQDDWDFGSPTFYFGLDHGNGGNPVLDASSTAQDVVTNARNAWYGNKQYFKNDYNQVHLFGKEVINYEGGQHFTNFTVPPYIQSMYAAQYTPGIYALYDEVIDTIRRWDARLAMHFSLAGRQESIYGSWGSVSDIDQQGPYFSTAPKYQALLDNIGDCPPPASGTVLPLQKEPGIVVAPNPASQQLSVYKIDNQAIRTIELFQADGRPVLTQVCAQGTTRADLNVENLPAGLYFLRITCPDGRVALRKVAVE